VSVDTLEKWCDRILQWGLVSLVVFTPLAFGTVEAWSIALMEWGIWMLILVAILRVGIGGFARTGLEIPIALFVAFCALQMVPVPVAWLQVLSPRVAEMYSTVDVIAASPISIAQPGAGDAALLDPDLPAYRPVSIDPADTFNRLLLVISFAGLFFLVAWWSARPERALQLILAVTITAFAVSLFGLVQYLTWNGRIYWFRRIPSTSAFGPFVNHNHFAGYVGLVIPIAVCLAFFAFEQKRFGGRKDEIASERWGRAGLALFAAAVLVAALFFSLSRGGILSSAIGGLGLFILVSRRVTSRLLAWSVAAVLIVVALGFIAWIGADVVSNQIGSYRTIENEASFRFRAVVWKAMAENIAPLLKTGSGLGTFEESFAPFTPPGSARRWDKAHNDYLQLLWETGVVGFLLFAAAAFVFIRRFWWPALRAREGPLSLFRVGLAISVFTIALHSIVDFNLQIGANGFLFALVSGVLVGLHRAAETERASA